MANFAKATVRTVKLGQIIKLASGLPDVSRNIRDASDTYSMDNPSFAINIVQSIRDVAVQTGTSGLLEMPHLMESKDDRNVLVIIKGHRRIMGLHIVYNGNPDTEFKAVVYGYMDPEQFGTLLMDHDTEPLRPVEVYFSIAKGKREYGMTQEAIANRLRGLLEMVGKPLTDANKEKIGYKFLLSTDPSHRDQRLEAEKKFFEHYRGTVQKHVRVVELPPCVETAWTDKLRGKQSWPKDNEVVELHQIFTAECKNPVYGRENPGPSFLERWNKIIAAVEEAATAGERPKSTGMKNRKDLDEAKKNLKSVILRTQLAWVVNELPKEFNYKEFVDIVCDIESQLPDLLKQRLWTLLGVPTEPPAPAATT